MVGLMYSIYNDPGMMNAMVTDYNDDIRSVGFEGVKSLLDPNFHFRDSSMIENIGDEVISI